MDSDMPADMDGLLEAIDIASAVAAAAAATTLHTTGLANDLPSNEALPVRAIGEAVDALMQHDPVPSTSPSSTRLAHVSLPPNEILPVSANKASEDASIVPLAASVASAQDAINVDTPEKPKRQSTLHSALSVASKQEAINVDTPEKPKQQPVNVDTPEKPEKQLPVMPASKRISLAKVYGYDPNAEKEFAGMPEEDHNNLRNIQLSYLSHAPMIGYCSFPLWRVNKWYEDLRFASIIDDPSKKILCQWNYQVVVISPSAPESERSTNKKTKPKREKFEKLLTGFYQKGFTNSAHTKACIIWAVTYHTSIMIVVSKVVEPDVPFADRKDIHLRIIAAITFAPGHVRTNKTKVDAFISWCLVANALPNVHPPDSETWRKHGFGLFLIIAVIKYCQAFSMMSPVKSVELYLQCCEPEAIQFFLNIGFQQMIPKEDADGYKMLPSYIRKNVPQVGLLTRKVVKGDPDQATERKIRLWHDDTKDIKYCLMKLPSQGLQYLKPDVVEKQPSQLGQRPYWCEYPPPLVRDKVLDKHFASMKHLFYGLPLIKALLPSPYQKMAGRCTIKGDMSLDRRRHLDHKPAEGWMATSELDLMFAILRFDGRYDDLCFFIPCALVECIKRTFEAFQAYMQLLVESHQPPDPAATAEDKQAAIRALNDGRDQYQKMQNHIVKVLVIPKGAASILAHRMIVFACNERGNHWSAVYVFNPSAINSSEADKNGLRSCFFRCCSFRPNGRRAMPNMHGINWYLNLLVSWDEHTKSNPSAVIDKFEMLAPFPLEQQGNMKGTSKFPALYLFSDRTSFASKKEEKMFNAGYYAAADPKVFPVQADNSNCGFGVITTTAMILRDLVSSEKYNEMFSKEAMPIKTCDAANEIFCDMPIDNILPLLLPGEVAAGRKYLPDAREQWFVVFDRLAEMQYDLEPKKLFKDWEVPSCYTDCKQKVKEWPLILPKIHAEWKEQVISNRGCDADVPFEPQTLSVPLRRKPDDVEECAKRLLKKIRMKDPSDADELEKATTDQSLSQKVCAQSLATFNRVASRNFDPISDEDETDDRKPIAADEDVDELPLVEKSVFNKKLEDFIESSFIAWGWHSNAKYAEELNNWRKKLKKHDVSDATKGNIKEWLIMLKQERQKYRKHFANEYKCTQEVGFVRSVRFDKATNLFFAKLAWTEVHKSSKFPMEEEVEIEEAWVKEAFKAPMFQHIINMRQDEPNWTQVPRDVAFMLKKKKIVKLRYMPQTTRSIVDSAALVAKLNAALEAKKKMSTVKEEAKPSSRIVRKRSRLSQESSASSTRNESADAIPSTPKKMAVETIAGPLLRSSPHKPTRLDWEAQRTSDDEFIEAIKEEDKPRRDIIVEARWTGKTADGGTTTLDESFVRDAFGDDFTNELKRLNRAWVDIPVGDNKPSRLYEFPHLKVVGAPFIRYCQSDGKDLCVSKSLASVFAALGWESESEQINSYGEKVLRGSGVDTMKVVKDYARSILPSWLLIQRLPCEWNWKTDMTDEEIVLGVLFASDDSCSHAVAINGSYVYDANETVALPLCDDALDYCTSTEKVQSKFVKMKLAYRFSYGGSQESKRAMLRLNN